MHLPLNLVNTTIKTKKFPESKKISKILPHIKNNSDLTNPVNLRPINIISVMSKVIEKVMCNQIINYLILNNLVPQSLQGGMKGRSSTTTVSEIYELLVQSLSNKKRAILITMDQSAAYDIVNHQILRKKLEHIGIKFSSTDLIMDYLTNRR